MKVTKEQKEQILLVQFSTQHAIVGTGLRVGLGNRIGKPWFGDCSLSLYVYTQYVIRKQNNFSSQRSLWVIKVSPPSSSVSVAIQDTPLDSQRLKKHIALFCDRILKGGKLIRSDHQLKTADKPKQAGATQIIGRPEVNFATCAFAFYNSLALESVACMLLCFSESVVCWCGCHSLWHAAVLLACQSLCNLMIFFLSSFSTAANQTLS